MATCRVYLPTFRRPQLLPRAVDSLLRQTFSDWICEVHNDDPQDPSPGELIAKIADPRFTVVNHKQNLGAIRTFNLFFKPVAEPFFALLEDDNWWEPEFLQTMLAAMSKHPSVQVSWANMRLWEECLDGSWHDTGRNVWDAGWQEPRLMHWANPRQMNGALHSNGAMLARSNFEYFPVPESIDFAAIEPFRERTFVHPLLFVPQVLANFAITRTTARPSDAASWMHALAVLTGTYLSDLNLPAEQLRNIWAKARNPSRSTHVLFACTAHFKGCRRMIPRATLNDWFWTCAYTLRHPLRIFKTVCLLRQKKTEEKFLARHTRARHAESQSAIAVRAVELEGAQGQHACFSVSPDSQRQ
jgi:glycosyltransferase involved in cell wall biosynthesis